MTAQTSDGRSRPDQRTPADQAETRQQLQPAANTIAAVIREAGKPSEPDRGCTPKGENRKSDLCAQWKAADAAQEAARYGFWSLLTGLVGTGLLVWTLWETRANARRELRAYVSVEPGVFQQVSQSDGTRAMTLEIKMHNGGSTPAYRAVHAGNIVLLSDEHVKSFLTQQYDNAPRIGEPAPVTIHSSQTTLGEIVAHKHFKREDLDRLMAGAVSLYVFGAVEYVDAFSKDRTTQFCFTISGNQFEYGEKLGSANLGKTMPMAWQIARFHNDAT